jgi:hypothetical protein
MNGVQYISDYATFQNHVQQIHEFYQTHLKDDVR